MGNGQLKAHPRRPPRPIPIKSSTNKNKAVEDEESVGQPAAPSTGNIEIEAVASTECVETNHSSVFHVQTERDGSNVGTTINSVHVGTVTNTGHVEIKPSKQETEHVGTHSGLHVITPVNPP